ncbi:MAG: nucleotidyltransferase domain-containing protein [Polaromonas sp.]
MKPSLLSQVLAQPDQQPTLTLSDWESILGQARQASLLGRLAQHYADHHWLAAVPKQPRQYLDGALRLVARQHHEVQWEVHCIRRALAHVDTPVVMLKGAAYFVAGLPPRHGRLFSDIDIMVTRERLPEVEGALFRAGWISEERDAYNQRYYREWMHEIPPMKHVQRGTVIDVHHTITPPTSRFKVDSARLFDHIEAIDDRADLFILAPVDMVLHSAVHLFQEGEFSHGLRDLMDINDLLLFFSKDPGFWRALFARAQELGLGEPLFHALHHTQRLLGTGTPLELRRELQDILPDWMTRRVLSVLLNRALQPRHPSCDGPFSDFARWLLYVRAHYLRMPWYLIVPHLTRKAWMRYFPNGNSAIVDANHAPH